jgi:ABC-2 type transport system permease protein
MPVEVRMALPSYGFIAWRGLFTDPVQTGPLLVGIAVGLAWAAAATALAYRLFMRRDFTDLAYDGVGRRVLVGGVLPLTALLAVTVAVIAGATSASGSGIDQAKLNRSLATSFAHLYRMQTEQLHRPAVTEAQLRSSAACDKGGSRVDDVGPGNDWRCVVKWRLPGSTAVGSAIYQLDVTPDGRYVADGDGPQQVNGFFQIRTSKGDVPNPLWQFDSSVDLLTPISDR